MAHVTFLRDFDWSPAERPQTVIAYKAGKTYSVRQSCADAAIAAGAAEAVMVAAEAEAQDGETAH